MDADLSHPPQEIVALVVSDHRRSGRHGDRQPLCARAARRPGWPLYRKGISRVASAAAYPLTGIHDSMCGFFAIRRSLLARLCSRRDWLQNRLRNHRPRRTESARPGSPDRLPRSGARHFEDEPRRRDDLLASLAGRRRAHRFAPRATRTRGTAAIRLVRRPRPELARSRQSDCVSPVCRSDAPAPGAASLLQSSRQGATKRMSVAKNALP